MDEHMENNELHEPHQSAYRKNHSCETALTKIVSDILQHTDNKKCVILVMLDMSAAFDTVKHSTLLKRFEKRFGIGEDVQKWLNSYFLERSQCVRIGNTMSKPVPLTSGVPQGSILGPKAYPSYVSPIFSIAKKYGISAHMYADDTQLYLEFSPAEYSSAKAKMENCIAEIRQWISANSLKLNDDKTELLIIGQKHQKEKIAHQPSISIGNTLIKPSQVACNIGAMLDPELNMDEQVKSITRTCYGKLKQLGRIRCYLNDESVQTLVHAFITCKLDNLNSLLIGLSKTQLRKLQRIQNNAARLITRCHKYESMTSTLKELHWLPVEARIKYKVLLLTHKGINGIAPTYIKDMFQYKENVKTLRSSNNDHLEVTNARLKTFGDRAFAIYAPHLWNSLPLALRQLTSTNSFKSELKTYLFKKHYEEL